VGPNLARRARSRYRACDERARIRANSAPSARRKGSACSATRAAGTAAHRSFPGSCAAPASVTAQAV